ncbi:hypothetical protein SDC9_158841 [bioreactor metagenome]|uniref:Uncharacterized protein n=1 Tax=bioreactor metagenome TaxID=1076179 RepID=A0A645FAZ6_9ZZZZ
MLNQNNRGAELVVHVQDEAAHVLLLFHVHAGHRLVEQQHLRLHGQRAAQVHALLQTVGQLAHGRFAEGLDFQEVDDVFDELAVLDFFALCRADAQSLKQHIAFDLQVAAGHDVVDHAHALEQCQVLERACHAHLGHLAAVHVIEGLAAEGDRAFARCVHAVDAVEHGALASAVRADDGANLMLLHVERDVGERLHAAESEADVLDVQNDITDFFIVAHDGCLPRVAAQAVALWSLASLIFSVALTLPLRPSSNFTWVSTNCSVLPA